MIFFGLKDKSICFRSTHTHPYPSHLNQYVELKPFDEDSLTRIEIRIMAYAHIRTRGYLLELNPKCKSVERYFILLFSSEKKY